MAPQKQVNKQGLDLAGGGQEFFSDLEICMLRRAVQGHAPTPPPKKKLSSANWYVLVYIWSKCCL